MAVKKRGTKCPACGGSYFVTTNKYSKKRKPRGDMFKLKEQYAAQRMPELHKTAVGGNIVCPNCEESMLDRDGMVILKEDYSE